MKPQNKFKNRQEPKKRTLNPPQFEYAPIDMRNPNIFWNSAIIKQELKGGFVR